MRPVRTVGLLGLVVLLVATSAEAVIMRLTPLADVLAESAVIVVAKVESLDADKLQMVLAVGETLKGKAAFAKLPMLLKGDAEAAKGKQVPQLLARLKAELPIVLFINQREREYVAFGYTNGTWFQATGVQPADADAPRWSWLHFEPYFRRTFKGTTQELRDTVAEVLAGKRKPPEANAKELPGLGPEVEAKEKEGPAGLEPRGGVIVAPWLVGPIALLGMIFPALFGGLAAGTYRWMTWLSVVSLNSTLVLVRDYWLSWAYPDAWFSSDATLWLAMAAITAVGIWWAWHRVGDRAANHQPGLWEVVTLVCVAGLLAVPILIWQPRSVGAMSLLMKTFGVMFLGMAVATLHAGLAAVFRATPRLPGEGVALLTMLLASVAFLPAGGQTAALADDEGGTGGKPRLRGVAWRFELPEPSSIYSSPVFVGDRAYVGAVHGSAFRSGALYCVEAATGKRLWSFTADGKMKDVFCSPTVADGRVYVGEGFHHHSQCRMFCLDAKTGEKLWEYTTGSHTESTPTVADGRVYFGAGDDGLYCLDAKTGEKLWNLPGYHIDANPLVADGKVYVGSGKGDVFGTTIDDYMIFCLDAVTGKKVWDMPTGLPAWGGPALAGDRLLVGVGNGNFGMSDDQPAGAVLALDAKTGQRIWRTDAKQVRDGVHVRLATDGTRVWVASRDQRVVCLSVADGKTIWEQELGSPIVASPALVPDLLTSASLGLGQPASRHATAYASLVVATSDGLVYCLDPATGEPRWRFDAGETAPAEVVSSPAVVVGLDPTGERRRIAFGATLNGNKGVLFCLEDVRRP